MPGLNWTQLFGLAGFATLISVVGAILGYILKDFVLARWFENWKANREARTSLAVLISPMFRSACELLTRSQDIYDDYPPDYLKADALKAPQAYLEINDTSDPHYRHYKLVSTLYRFCSFWGWVELFRRDVAFVQGSESKKITNIQAALGAVTSDIAEGQINKHKDWDTWRDRLIFREELRAVGESMLCPLPQQNVVGYATFCDYVAKGTKPEWLNLCYQFFMNLDKKKDFRRERFLRLIVHLYELLDILDKKKIPDYISATRNRYRLPVV